MTPLKTHPSPLREWKKLISSTQCICQSNYSLFLKYCDIYASVSTHLYFKSILNSVLSYILYVLIIYARIRLYIVFNFIVNFFNFFIIFIFSLLIHPQPPPPQLICQCLLVPLGISSSRMI